VGLGVLGCPDGARVDAEFHARPVVRVWSGRWGAGSRGVQGLEAVPGGGQVGGPFPAGLDLQEAAGVGDQAGRGGQDPEAQRLRAGRGQLVVQGEVAQPGGQRGGQGGQLQAVLRP
jgi:hypothetical protein